MNEARGSRWTDVRPDFIVLHTLQFSHIRDTHLISADLVGSVAVGYDPVSAHDHRRDLLALQQRGDHVIAD